MIREEEQFCKLQQKTIGKAGLLIAFKTNYRELFVAMCIVLCFTMSFADNFSSYMILLICDDITDANELADASMYISIASFAELGFKFILMVYPSIIQKRKKCFAVGLFSSSAMWGVMIYLYWHNQWTLIKISIIVWMMIIGGGFMAPYYSIISDLLTGDLIGVVVAFDRICSIGVQYFFSLVFVKKVGSTNYWQASAVFCATSFICGLMISLFFFESYGLTKVQIFELLSAKSTKNVAKPIAKSPAVRTLSPKAVS